MRKAILLAAALVSAVLLTACTRNGTATESSPDHGAQNAEGGITPNASTIKDSASDSRQNVPSHESSPGGTGTYDDTVPQRRR